MTITPELKHAIEQAGDEPVRVEDPETHSAYVLIRVDLYDKMRKTFQREEIDASYFEYEKFIPRKK